MKTVNIPAKACPVVDEVDVLVVGGGAAGIGAALGAAQCGASVALVEYFGALGGLLTNGYVTNCEAGVAISGDKILIKGVFDKLVTRMVEKGGAIRGYDLIRSNKYYPFDTSRCENDLQITPWDPEAFKLSADELMAEHGVKVYFYTQFTEILKEGNKVVGGVIENRSGRQVILAKRVVDCTGAAAVAQMAGAECCGVGRKGSMTLMFRVGNVKNVVPSYKPNVKEIPYGAVNFFPLIREGDFRVEMTRYIGSENSAEDYTKGTIECRRQCQEVLQYLKEHWIGFEDAYIIDTAPTLGSLAQPALVGEKKMTQEMILKREMPDPEIMAQFKSIPASNNADVMGRSCAMNPRIKLVSQPKDQMMVGPAYTVKGRAGDNLALHAALNLCQEGDVLVVSNEEDDTRALMGEVMM